MSLAIGPGTAVTLHFALLLEDGSEVDSTFSRQPAVFVFGDGKLLPGVELKLLGLVAGDQQELVQAFEERIEPFKPAAVRQHIGEALAGKTI